LVLGPEDWRRVGCPTLVAPGAHDFLWPPSVAQGVADLIPGARLEILGDAGHFPHLQDPAALSRMALSFFAE
jgi:pimeloyl-ACP methyl ester carboxylesterase